MEEWKLIKEIPFYEVSSYGNIRSIDRDIIYSNGRVHKYKGTIKNISIGDTGYCTVTLCMNSKSFGRYVHRLVATEFLDKPMGANQVNHKDHDRTNNNVENLEWVTPSQNMKHAHGSRPRSKYQNSFFTELEVIKIIKRFNKGESIKDIHNDYPMVHIITIQKIYNGDRWRHLNKFRKYDRLKFKNNHVKNNPELITNIFNLRSKGYSISKISRELDVARATIRNIINNKVEDIVHA